MSFDETRDESTAGLEVLRGQSFAEMSGFYFQN
jgi:hypothetical protein